MKEKKPSSLDTRSRVKNLTLLAASCPPCRRCWGWRPTCVFGWWPEAYWPPGPAWMGEGIWAVLAGWAVWFAVGSILLYFAALMSTHIAAFRTAGTSGAPP